MTWGFKGIFKRVLEFPAAAAEAMLAPSGRMRMRYNEVLDRAELSTNGGPWLPITTSATVAYQPGIQPMQVILQSEALSARRRLPFYLVAPDGVTPVTGLVFAASDIQISKNGAAFADSIGSMTEVGEGLYNYDFTAAEVDTLGNVVVKVAEASIRTAIASAQVVAYDPNTQAVGVWSTTMTGLAVPGTTGWAQLLSLYQGQYGPGIYVDTYYPGTAGTVPGVNGTPNNPVANLTAARTLADALNIRTYYITGLTTLTATSQDFLFVGAGGEQFWDTVDISGADCFGATFTGIRLTGAFAANENAGNIACYECAIHSIDNITGSFQNCFFTGIQAIPTGAFDFQQVHLINCSEAPPFGSAPSNWSLGGASPTNTQVMITGYRGQLTISNLVNDTTVFSGGFDGAALTFAASCTSTIEPVLYGDFELINLGTVAPDVTAQSQEVVDDVLTAAHGAGAWT